MDDNEGISYIIRIIEKCYGKSEKIWKEVHGEGGNNKEGVVVDNGATIEAGNEEANNNDDDSDSSDDSSESGDDSDISLVGV